MPPFLHWCRSRASPPIESAMVANTRLVAEAAVVGRPDEMTGEAVCAFVVLKGPRPSGDEAKKMADELRNRVAKEIGAIAKPKDIRSATSCPKRARARSCGASCARSPRARRSSRTSRHWRIPRSSNSSSSLLSRVALSGLLAQNPRYDGEVDERFKSHAWKACLG